MDSLLGALKSKTIWTQIIGFAAMAGAMFGFEIAPEDQATIATGIMGAVNAVGVIVRFFTDKPLAEKAKPAT